MVTLLTRSLCRKLRGMSALTAEIARISKTKTKRITVGKKSVRNLFYRRRRQRSSSATSKTDVSFGFEADVVVALGLKEEINLLAAKVPPRCPPCCLHRSANRACTFNISAERNLWLQSALRSFAIVCDYMETALFCDRLRSAIRDRLRSSAIVCDHMETSLIDPLHKWRLNLNNNTYTSLASHSCEKLLCLKT